MHEFLFWAAVSVTTAIVFPLWVYVSAKMATLGYLRAREWFEGNRSCGTNPYPGDGAEQKRQPNDDPYDPNPRDYH